MTWLDELQGCDSLKAFLQHTTVPLLVSRPEGAILWANAAFLNWSGFSGAELQKYGWKQITVPGDELDADTKKAESWDDFAPVYSQLKQYYRKNQSPAWGVVSPMRFPPYGPIEFCITTWLPCEGTSDKSLELAVTYIQASEKEIKALKDTVSAYSIITEEQRFIMNAVVVAQKHPRITWGVLAVGLGLLGLNNALEILKTINIVPEPARPVFAEPRRPVSVDQVNPGA